jgi:DNA-binding transcriptional LysR family regulator
MVNEMNLLQLKYFQKVAEIEHMTRAANELNIAQPSLSKVITHLEEELGVPLFDRVGRQIRLNQYGKAFLFQIEKVFVNLEDAKTQLRDMQGMEEQIIKMSFNNMYPFAKLIKEFTNLHPKTKFHQTIGSFSESRKQLLTGKIDLCISSPPLTGEDIECIPLIVEEIFLVVPRGHRFADRDSINLIETSGESFISLKEGFGIRDITDNYCRQAGFIPNIVFESQAAINILDLINANLGIAFLPIKLLEKSTRENLIMLHINDFTAERTTALSYMKNRYLPLAVMQFRDFVIKKYVGN